MSFINEILTSSKGYVESKGYLKYIFVKKYFKCIKFGFHHLEVYYRTIFINCSNINIGCLFVAKLQEKNWSQKIIKSPKPKKTRSLVLSIINK